MKSPTLEVYEQEFFQIQAPICAVSFPSNISVSGRSWHNLWNLLTIKLKNKSFHNSIDLSGLYLKMYIPSWLEKIIRFTVFRLLKSAFAKFPRHDMIWSLILHVKHQLSISFHKKVCSSIFQKSFPFTKKLPLYFREDTLPLLHWKFMRGYLFLDLCK